MRVMGEYVLREEVDCEQEYRVDDADGLVGTGDFFHPPDGADRVNGTDGVGTSNRTSPMVVTVASPSVAIQTDASANYRKLLRKRNFTHIEGTTQ